MAKAKISTIIIIICILIIGLYAMGEVNYFSSKISVERNVTSPVIVIDKIGVSEKLNNVSLSQGVLIEQKSNLPTEGDVLIFGHRTLQGSPFLRLDELNSGDEISLQWPGIGEVNYKVINKTVVPASYQINSYENGDKIYLITCDPIGSTANRLIIEGQLENVSSINDEILQDNPQEMYSFYIAIGFLIIGLIISLIQPKDSRVYVLITVIIVSAILLYCCFNPIPSQWIYDKIIFLNGGI